MKKTDEILEPGKVAEMGKLCVCFNTRKAARAVTQLYDEVLKPTGLRVTQLALLPAVKILGPVTVKKLARAAVMDRTTLTRNLKPLEKNGLVRIEPGDDLRERKVTLTDLGSKKLQEAYPLWEKAQETITGRLGEEGLDHLLRGLSELVSATRKKRP